jgi:hypothetical protein
MVKTPHPSRRYCIALEPRIIAYDELVIRGILIVGALVLAVFFVLLAFAPG